MLNFATDILSFALAPDLHFTTKLCIWGYGKNHRKFSS